MALAKMGLGRFMMTVSPPLGIAYISAYLRSRGYEAIIVDANAENLSEREVVLRIKRFRPDLVGFSIHTEVIFNAKIAEEIKRYDHRIITVAGGVAPSYIPRLILEKFTMFDFAVIGEGEMILHSLINTLEKKERLDKVKGIAYRQDGRVMLTPKQEYIQDLDSLPFPDRGSLPNNLYGISLRGPITLIETSRGCSGNCWFCAIATMFGSKIRTRDPQKVVAEIEESYCNYDIDFFILIDNTFTARKEYVYAITDEIIKRRLHKKIRWRCMTRVDCVDEQILKNMRRAGCREIGFGVESPHQDTLNFYRKGTTLKEVENAFALAKKAGLSTAALMIVNQYERNLDGAGKETIKFVKRIKAKRMILQPLIVYPQSSLHKYLLMKGRIKDENYNPFFEGKYLESKYIDFKRLIKITNNMYLSFYISLDYFIVVIKNIPLWKILHKIRIYLKNLFYK